MAPQTQWASKRNEDESSFYGRSPKVQKVEALLPPSQPPFTREEIETTPTTTSTSFSNDSDCAVVSRPGPILTRLQQSADDNDHMSLSFCRGPFINRMLHFQQLDEWSCGYRNLQTILSCVCVEKTSIPSVVEIQALLERSWKDGFDSKGAYHFNHRIRGTCAEIGAVEVSSLLSFVSVDNVVVQFEKKNPENDKRWHSFRRFVSLYFSRSHVDETASGTAQRIIRDLYDGNENEEQPPAEFTSSREFSFTDNLYVKSVLCQCGVPVLPLYLQWEGHSITIVGIERCPSLRGGGRRRESNSCSYNLIVWDPKQAMVLPPSGSANETRKVLETWRLPIESLKGQFLQIILYTNRTLTTKERSRAKRRLKSFAVD